MINTVGSNEDAYIQACMAKLPEVKKGEARVIKKSDNLWNIAREKLGKKSKKSEVQNYMMAIAKLNGLNTAKKMNNLQVNSTIYLPQDLNTDNPGSNKSNIFRFGNVQPPAATTPAPDNTPAVNKTEKTSPVTKPEEVTKPESKNTPVKQKTSAEISFQDILNKLYGDDVTVTQSGNSTLYFVRVKKVEKDGYYESNVVRHIVGFNYDEKNNKITQISFDDNNDKDGSKYDYDLFTNNVIVQRGDWRMKECGKITPEQRKKLDSRLIYLVKNCLVKGYNL